MSKEKDEGNFLGYDRNDPEDLVELTRLLARIAMWIAYFIIAYFYLKVIYFTGEKPPEPEFILQWRAFVYWWLGWN